jgi:hypothetical protein
MLAVVGLLPRTASSKARHRLGQPARERLAQAKPTAMLDHADLVGDTSSRTGESDDGADDTRSKREDTGALGTPSRTPEALPAPSLSISDWTPGALVP